MSVNELTNSLLKGFDDIILLSNLIRKIKQLDTIDLPTKLQVCKELLEMVRDENE